MVEEVFPDVRWGHEPSPVIGRPITAFASSRAGTWTLRKLKGLDQRLLERSNGRHTIFGPIAAPLLLLTTVGEKSGVRRTTPLMYMREGARLFVIGSNYGQARHPSWTGNLLADPLAWVRIGDQDIPVTATPVTGDEYDRVFAMFTDFNHTYDTYRRRTDRKLRIFALSRR